MNYGYRERGKSVLSGGSLLLLAGDRVILKEPSGSGKSTLAALLAGLRQPTAGIILLRGLDQHTLGLEAWRRQIVVAPQFHENHVLTVPFAFNLLMARRCCKRPRWSFSTKASLRSIRKRFKRALPCMLKRAKTLVVVAHP